MKKPTYSDGLHDGQQLKTFMDFRKIRKYIEDYVGGMVITFEDEGKLHRVTNKKFANDLSKVIVNRLNKS